MVYLANKDFKTIFKIPKELRKGVGRKIKKMMSEQNGNINKDTENLNSRTKGITEIQNSLEGFKGRVEKKE